MDWRAQGHGLGGSMTLNWEAQGKTFGDLRSWIGRFKGTDWGVAFGDLRSWIGRLKDVNWEDRGHGLVGSVT